MHLFRSHNLHSRFQLAICLVVVGDLDRTSLGCGYDAAIASPNRKSNPADCQSDPRRTLSSPEAGLLPVAFPIAYHPKWKPEAATILEFYLRRRIEEHDLVPPISFSWVPSRRLDSLRSPVRLILLWVQASDPVLRRRYDVRMMVVAIGR